MKLNLSAAQELVFMHHASVFRENGYEFNLNDDGENFIKCNVLICIDIFVQHLLARG